MFKFFERNIERAYDFFGSYYLSTLLVFHVLYFSTLFGIVALNTKYLDAFKVVVDTLICLFLMFRFNPYREKIRIKPHDSVIVFSSSLFLLLNTTVIEVLKKFFPKYTDQVDKLAKII